mgnify:CR=1 FL=1
MHRPGLGEGQLLGNPGLDEGREVLRPFEHGRAHIDEPVDALRPREDPGQAVRAEIVPRSAVQAADHRLPLDHREAFRRDGGREREGRGAHLLAAGAVAGHGDERRGTHPYPHLPAAAGAFPREFPVTHVGSPSLASGRPSHGRAAASPPQGR